MNDFPPNFLWGAATAAHQVEGNSLNTDLWVMEHTPGTPFAEPSGDACDHYRLFRQDIELLSEVGLNCYRFSIEWARVEPEPGLISSAALAHYREMLDACHEKGLIPIVTLHHFTSPRWLMKLGGWQSEETPARFAAYCGAVMRELGPLIPYACTVNEANLPRSFAMRGRAPLRTGDWWQTFTRALNAPESSLSFLDAGSAQARQLILDAHRLAVEAIRAASPETQAGITLALHDVQPVAGEEERAEALQEEVCDAFLRAIASDDFLGVQTYTRLLVGPDGPLPVPEAAEQTQMGWEYYPEALEAVLRRVAASSSLPLLVTENGIATEDDSRRQGYIKTAVAGIGNCLRDGIDVRGYIHWSALDNFEWEHGYRPKFGLIAVDRATQRRYVKPSAHLLGELARSA